MPNTIHELAPFFDKNNDDIYNPEDGDYPLPESVHPSIIPTQLIWGVFNDGGSPHYNSEGLPLNAEIHQTIWSFYCTDNEMLNNSVFASFKIINKGDTNLDSMYVGFEADPNLGCANDDYIGCIPDLNTFYFYNEDPVDGYTNDGFCGDDVATFGNNPPVQAVSFLNKTMSSYNYYSLTSVGQPEILQPNNPMEFYTYLSGWIHTILGDVPLTYGGSGFNGSQQTYFAFPDHPLNTTGWSLATTILPTFENKSIASTYINSLPPNESTSIDLAFTFYQDEALNNFETVDMVYDNTPLIQQSYENEFENSCTYNPTCLDNCVWTGDANHDSIVTNLDILQIGLNYGTTGTVRNHPLIWQPFESQNWNTSFLNTDLKHTDCNGNGLIDSIDFEKSIGNFGRVYKTVPFTDTYNYGSELSISSSDNSDTLLTISAKFLRIKIAQEENIAALAFTIDCDKDVLNIKSSSTISFWPINQVAVSYTHLTLPTNREV